MAFYRKETKPVELLSDVMSHAKFVVVRIIAAIGYQMCTHDSHYVNELFEEGDEEAKAIASPYVSDVKFLSDLYSINKKYLSDGEIRLLNMNIRILENRKETIQQEENINNIPNIINNIEQLLEILKTDNTLDKKHSNQEYREKVFNKINEIDENILAYVIINTDDFYIINEGIEHIVSEKALNILVKNKDKIENGYHYKLDEQVNNIKKNKTCPNNSHVFEFVKRTNDSYNNDVRIHYDIYQCKKCGLIKEEEYWDNGHSEINYKWPN